jgi:TP901-1 family phage major tail protein
MSAGIGIKGRDITMTVGAATLLGTTSKGITFNNESIDVTDDASSGWQELLATSGVKSAELSISGGVKNMELVQAYFASSNLLEVIQTYPDGSTVTGDFFLNNLSITGESNGLTTFDASFSSSGAVVFVAGT